MGILLNWKGGAQPTPILDPSTKPRLLDEVRHAIRRKHYSLRTEQSYTQWIRRFILYHGKRHPREMGAVEVERFLTHLAVDGKVASSTQNQALNAIVFLYRSVLGQELGWLQNVEHAKRPGRLPVVFTREEAQAILNRLEGTRWLMAGLLYGAGLRLMECLRLRVKDLEFERRQIVVREGKGAKDRVTMLPERLIEPLRLHLEKVKARHRKDLSEGFGTVYLPDALERKYLNVNREWAWQYVFPAFKRSIDPRSGVRAPAPPRSHGAAAGRQTSGAHRRAYQARKLSRHSFGHPPA